VNGVARNAHNRYLRAELLRLSGRAGEAAGWYGSIAQRASYDLMYLAPSALRLARIMDARGNTAGAAEHYRRFTALWGEADPELRAVVGEAGVRLGRVGN